MCAAQWHPAHSAETPRVLRPPLHTAAPLCEMLFFPSGHVDRESSCPLDTGDEDPALLILQPVCPARLQACIILHRSIQTSNILYEAVGIDRNANITQLHNIAEQEGREVFFVRI